MVRGSQVQSFWSRKSGFGWRRGQRDLSGQFNTLEGPWGLGRPCAYLWNNGLEGQGQ